MLWRIVALAIFWVAVVSALWALISYYHNGKKYVAKTYTIDCEISYFDGSPARASYRVEARDAVNASYIVKDYIKRDYPGAKQVNIEVKPALWRGR